MATIVGAMPVAVALGDGTGFTGAYVLAGLVLLLFSVGYAAMSRHVTDAGAFYSYAARGLGPRPQSATAYVALVAYNAMAIALSVAFGFFAHSSFRASCTSTSPGRRGGASGWRWPAGCHTASSP